ncbi:AMP-binding protein [Microbacterium sp. No. 7]|uniref:AMP-binding protein n=1 Tax=Microbacterium sp. No. 7 TaxID=1714373 RepID=UPI0006D2A129|nr:AMP-binding protein [Microbacterium sp. No. 7]
MSHRGTARGEAIADPFAGIRLPAPDRAAHYRARGDWRDRTIVDDIFAFVDATPDRTALVCYRQGAEQPDSFTYRQLGEAADRLAQALADLGVGRGDVVSLQLASGWECAVAVLAAMRAGAVVNPLVTILRRRELEFMLGRAASKVLFVPASFRGFDHLGLARELRPALPALEHVVVVGGEGRLGDELAFEGLLRTGLPGAGSPVPRARRGDEVASLMYTSGTTGEPKGTLHTYDTLWSAGRAMFDSLGLDDRDVSFMASPMGHLTGFLWGLLQPLSRGMTAVFQDVWDPARFLEAVEEQSITWTIGATPFVVDAIAEQERSPRSLTTFRHFVCAGAPIPRTLSARAQNVLGAKLMAQWGTSECGGVTVHGPADDVETVAASDGRRTPYMELKIVDEWGRAVGLGVEGRLIARGPSVFVGYLGRQDLYDDVVDEDGWFDTGDLGTWVEEDLVRITGRSKDIIIRGGENIPVVEVENLLLEYPGVQEAAVVGVPDPRMGERGCAVLVVAGPPPSLADLVAHLADAGMATQYWPEFLWVVDEMPRTPSGKIQKFLLRAAVGDGGAPPEGARAFEAARTVPRAEAPA